MRPLELGERPRISRLLRRFANVDVINRYGLLLQDFKDNGEFVNNCVFTMMHHVTGDLGAVSMLFQPNILQTFAQIWEAGFEICEVSCAPDVARLNETERNVFAGLVRFGRVRDPQVH